MPSFAVHYLAAPGLAALAPDNILGVVGYGAERPAFLPAPSPFIAAPLRPAGGGEIFEAWVITSPTEPFHLGRVAGACGDTMAFGAVTIDATVPLQAAVEAAYLNIFDFLDQTGFVAPIRFWNYLTDILGDDAGLERYRHFNIGRHQAFSARLGEKLPPAASGVGGHFGASVIYFLAARDPATPIENPRQVSAYNYPKIYGPRSPSFSRAGTYGQALFISGTASIVGHETRHRGDLPAQIAETAANLRALIGATTPMTGEWAAKIYLQNPDFQAEVEPAIEAIFGPGAKRLYLRGELCRADLLVEIEAFRQP